MCVHVHVYRLKYWFGWVCSTEYSVIYCCLVVRLCLAFCNPLDCSPPGSPPMLNIAKFFLPWFSPTWTSTSFPVQVISSCWSYHRTILFHFICAVLWPCFSLAHFVVLHGFVTIRCDSKCSVNQSVLERQWKSNKGHEDTMKISMSFHGKKFQSLKVICRVLKNYFFFLIANHFLAHEEIPGSKYIVGVKWGLECRRNQIRFILLESLGPKLASERSVAAPSQADFLKDTYRE